MEFLFAPFRPDACCLCGSTEALTGEHKIKASALRMEFGGDPMLIGRFGDPDADHRLAQGPKSNVLHFGAPICGPCNNARTQEADLEFDRFNHVAQQLLKRGEAPNRVFDEPRYIPESAPYLNVFRYFAKILCCHMADVEAPRRLRMARFALGTIDRNCIWLKVDEDWTYKRTAAAFGRYQYAAHGGLVIYADKNTHMANGIHSTLTIGPLRYVFFSHFTWLESFAIRHFHRHFCDMCRAAAATAIAEPLSEEGYLRLGI